MFYSTLAAAAVKFYVFCVVYLRRIEACHTDELLPVFVLLSGALITQPMLGHTLSRNMLAHINARTHTRAVNFTLQNTPIKRSSWISNLP